MPFPLQAFFTEMNSTFRNRLMNAENANIFDDILLTNGQLVFHIDKSLYYFIPNGANVTNLTKVNESEWADIVQKNITICGKLTLFLSFNQ